jgi:hypothetical protein
LPGEPGAEHAAPAGPSEPGRQGDADQHGDQHRWPADPRRAAARRYRDQPVAASAGACAERDAVQPPRGAPGG